MTPGVTRVKALRSSHRSHGELAPYVDRLLERVQNSSRAILRPGAVGPAPLHDLHRDLRRLRLVVDWRRRLKGSPPLGLLEDVAGHLRRLTRLAGRVRDLDVELALWQQYRPPPGRNRSVPDRALSTFGRRLQDDSRTGRELLKATLLAELHAGLFARIRRSLTGLTSRETTRILHDAVDRERRRLADRAARSRRKALGQPNAERMHQFRVWVRRLRYLSDLEDHLEGRHSATFPARYARLLRRLGELHDRDVMAAHLDTVDPSHRFEDWSRRFRADHRTLRKDLIAEIGELRPRRHLGRPRGGDA